MLTISGIAKSFGGRTLFKDVTLHIDRRSRFGLVGPNGAGKSTFFKILLGEETPDEGQTDFERGVVVGFLPQESASVGDETVLELATAISEEFCELRKRLVAWDNAHPDEIDPHDDVHTQFNELGGYQIEAKAKKILSGLSFRNSDFDRPAKELSGGWIMRAHLARLLVQEPDLLLLDEPTNHLDLESLIWLQIYLKSYPGAILMISHDREFLNQLISSIVEIRFGKFVKFTGNYDDYLVQRDHADAQHLAAYKSQQREIDRLMRFVDRFRSKNTKATQAQSKLRQIDRMEKVEAPLSDESSISFSFPQPDRAGQRVIRLKDIHHAYEKNIVYQGMEFEAERGQRIVLVGPNGAGKSTLLKILADVVKPQSGERELGHKVRAGYFSQNRIDVLNPDSTVLEEGLDTPQRVTEEFVRTVLGCFLFRGDDVFKKVSVLSGGEKSRLALVKLLMDPPNLLLMDEPTTHLDMASIEALIAALEQYRGTIIFISHDVYFIKAIADHVVRVQDGELRQFPAPYQYYVDKMAEEQKVAAGFQTPSASARPAPVSQANRKEQRRLEAAERQAKSKVKRKQQEIVKALEARIASLEKRQAELVALLEDPGSYEKDGGAAGYNRELAVGQRELIKLTAEWEAESEKLTAF